MMSSHKENMVSFSFTSSLWFKSHLLNNDYKIEVGVAVSGLTIFESIAHVSAANTKHGQQSLVA